MLSLWTPPLRGSRIAWTHATGQASCAENRVPHTEARDEIPGLQVWQDCGAVPLIDTDDDPNALLMAPCLPADAQLHPAVSADAHRSACREHPRTRRRMDTD